jgi:cell filamentation protein
MSYRPESDHYVYEDTGVLRNLANIRDAAELEHFETAATIFRQIELSAHPIPGDFDLPHLKAIHRHLFQDVYAWAGELRTVDIAKGSTRFAVHHYLESYAASVFAKLAKSRPTWVIADLPQHFAECLGEINAMHPFREGNGRTQRIFIGLLANAHGFAIRWEDMEASEMLAASITSFNGDNRPLSELIARHSGPSNSDTVSHTE